MKRLITVCLLLLAVVWGRGQNGYQLNINFKPFARQVIYLGYYFGKTYPITDSTRLDANGNGVFKGKEKLKPGIYLIGYPDKKNFFEILIEKNQQFSITADTGNVLNKLSIKNSPEGIVFQDYQKYMDLKGKQIRTINQQTQNASAADKQKLKAEQKKVNEEVLAYREGIIKKYPGSLLSTIFNTLREPVVPEASKHPGGRYDSVYAWYYFKSNFWNGVSFSDERLLRTPVFEPKFDTYFKDIVYPVKDSIIKEADKVLIASMKNKEMFKYLLSKLVQRYINPEYMGQDAVFVHLFEKYIATGSADWFDEKQKKYIFDRAYSLMGSLIGEAAAPLEMIDTAGNPKPLYNIKSDYVVICFWDPTCGHCKEVVPKLDSIYRAKWKAMGVSLYGVMTDGGLDNWKAYIREHHLSDWVHAYQTDEQKKADYAAGRPNFRQLYDITTTPKLYLLDKDKKIMAKQLNWEQLDDLLTRTLSKKP